MVLVCFYNWAPGVLEVVWKWPGFEPRLPGAVGSNPDATPLPSGALASISAASPASLPPFI